MLIEVNVDRDLPDTIEVSNEEGLMRQERVYYELRPSRFIASFLVTRRTRQKERAIKPGYGGPSRPQATSLAQAEP